MRLRFFISMDGEPNIYLDDVRVHLIYINYNWCTKTDVIYSNVFQTTIYAGGYLDNRINDRLTIGFNFITKTGCCTLSDGSVVDLIIDDVQEKTNERSDGE